MSSSLLVTIVIVLSELVIIFLVLAIMLFLRLRKLKSTARTIQPPTPAVAQPIETGPSLQAYIEEQITRTTHKLEDIANTDDHSQKSALASRLGLLKTEKQVLDTVVMDVEHENYWKAIEQFYQEEAVSLDGENSNTNKDAALISRLKKLEIFKDLFFNAQNKLKDSFDIINELKHTISSMHSDEENSQIEDMVDKLSVDNINLHKQLDKANQHLKSILDDAMQSISENGTIPTDTGNSPDSADKEITELRDENEFLVSQIQSLLQQELAHTKSLQERITELETSQNESESINIKLTDLQEENEFLTTQIQFLLQQEIQQTKNLQDRIAELEARLRKEQKKSTAPDNIPSDINNNTEETQQAVSDKNSGNKTVGTGVLDDITEDLDSIASQETNADSHNS